MINKAAYRKMLLEDLGWLRDEAPRALERDHLELVIMSAVVGLPSAPYPPAGVPQAVKERLLAEADEHQRRQKRERGEL